MSLHASTNSAEAAIHKQRRLAFISSAVIAILSVALVMLLLSFFLLAPIFKESPTIITYDLENVEESLERPTPKKQIDQKPSAPTAAVNKVIVSNVSANISVPNPDFAVAMPASDFGFETNFDDGIGFSDSNGAGEASFFNTKSNSQRVAYVIDYSASMNGKRDQLMREELGKSVSKLAPGMKYQLIFFAGPAWVAGDQVTMNQGAGTATVKSVNKSYEWKGHGAHNWKIDGAAQKVEWLDANGSQLKKSRKLIEETKLIYGTIWEPAIDMALQMQPPPQTIFFMTDGSCGGDMVSIAKKIAHRAKRKGVIINTVAMMEPKTKKAMQAMAKGTGGSFTLINADGKPEKVDD